MIAPTQHNDINAVSLLDTIRSLNQLKGVDMILDRTLFEARTLANADAGSIFLLENIVELVIE